MWSKDEQFKELYQRYYRPVLALFVRLGFSKDEAAELAQESFLRVYQGMDTYRGDSAWWFIQTTARRLALNEIRRRTTQKRVGIDVSLDQSVEVALLETPARAGPAEEYLLQERREQLSKAIKVLPEGIRQCLLLRLSGAGYHEIANHLGITLDAVKSRLYEARKRLRQQLDKDSDAGVS